MKVERHSKYLVYSSSSVSYGKTNVDLSSFACNILNLQYLSVAVKKKILYAIPKCLVEQTDVLLRLLWKWMVFISWSRVYILQSSYPPSSKMLLWHTGGHNYAFNKFTSRSRLTGRRFLGGGHRWCGEETLQRRSLELRWAVWCKGNSSMCPPL